MLRQTGRSFGQRISDLVNAGQMEAVEKVLQENADLQANEQLVLKCIKCEISSRISHGSFPSIGEYQRRFPKYALRLSSLAELSASSHEKAERHPQTILPDTPSWAEDIAAPSSHPGTLASALQNCDEAYAAKPLSEYSRVEEQLLHLYRQGSLTEFQTNEVAAGRVKSLILGGYTLLDRIGAGGMGEVFRAEHRRMARIVAIKMLSPAVTQDPETTARFEREARLAAKLLHSNIVTAFDADQFNGTRFLVMEYVEGQDLSVLVERGGPLPVAVALNYVLQAARGLQCAHGEGVIHRDIKPANLLLDTKGVVKILDMGIARIQVPRGAPMRSELTLQGDVFGTAEFMSPEQSFDTKNVDGRSDIYSLGCTLYYLIAGKPLYEGDTVVEKIVAHRESPIPSLQTVDASIPPQIDALFKKMVAKKLPHRYQTMTEVVASLAQFSRGDALPADQIPFYRNKAMLKQVGRLRKPLLFAVAALLLVGVGLAGVLSILKPLDERVAQPERFAAKDTPPPHNGMHTAPETSVSAIPVELPQQQLNPLFAETVEPPAAVAVDVHDELQMPADVADNDSRKEEAAPTGAIAADTKLNLPSEQEFQKLNQEQQEKESESVAASATLAPVVKTTVSSEVKVTPRAPEAKVDAAQQFTKHLARLPAEEQVTAVAQRLQELNPGFDGSESHLVDRGIVTQLRLSSDEVTDLSPIRALTTLTSLSCRGSDASRGKLADLSPLQGMSLTALDVSNTQVADLSPLHGMKLTSLNCTGTHVSSLAPLKGMPLKDLRCSQTPIDDLSPLRRMELTRLDCDHTRVASLRPLLDCKRLRALKVSNTNDMLSDLALIGINLPECTVERIDPGKQKNPPSPLPQP